MMSAQVLSAIFIPFIGTSLGAAGVFFMCLFQINRNERKDDEQ